MPKPDDSIEIESLTSPGHQQRVNRAKYTAMRDALFDVLPAASPGVTTAEAKNKLLANLPGDLFPGGAAAGWWLKAVQLDLEAKGFIGREATKPIRWLRRASS